MQIPVPTPSDSVRVPVPEAVEELRDIYLVGAFPKLVAFTAFALFLLLLVRIARGVVARQIDDVNRRHTLRKWIGYGAVFVLFLFSVALFADVLSGLGTVIAVLLAGIAIALQDILKSIVGWVYLSSRAGIEVGDRVEVQGIIGDVIDVGVLKTTVLEVGNLVYGRQSTGRLVTIPNYRMLAESVLVSGRDNPFVWHEVKVSVTFESDWQRAEAILRAAGDELHAETAPALHAAFRRLEGRYAFKYGTLTPIVYVRTADYGVELVLRYLTPVRRRRGSEDRVARRVLAAVAAEPRVEFAYPTYRAFRRGEGAPHPPPPRADARMEAGGEEGLPPPEMLPE